MVKSYYNFRQVANRPIEAHKSFLFPSFAEKKLASMQSSENKETSNNTFNELRETFSFITGWLIFLRCIASGYSRHFLEILALQAIFQRA